ncbi:MAG: ATP-NAD kinase, partial [Venatoribacter sp.]
MIKLGLIINPYAGIGGAVGLKGSDGETTRAEALARGAQRKAMSRTAQALAELSAFSQRFVFITVKGEMGSDTLDALGLP